MTTAFSDGSLQEGRIWAEDQLYFYKFFARGTWRFLDYRISPIVSCDLGVRWLANDNIYNCPYSIRDLEVDALTAMADEIDSQSYSGFYFSPAVGFSLRTANNLYLEAKIGYSFSSAIKEKSGSAAGRGRFYEYECSYTTPKRKLSAPFFSIGLTHTFRLGSNWGK